jgi:D-3-phosphoglycerate dehydrogenase / 2-oxoglutarate reductase
MMHSSLMKIAILDDWEKYCISHPEIKILNNYFEVTIYHDEPTTEELLNRIRDVDVIIPIRERTKFTKEILEQLRNIKLIAQTGSGLAHIDMEVAKQLGIPIMTTSGGSAGVVELIFGFIIAHSRKLPFLDRNMREGTWTHSIGFGLAGKTIGIIGLGKIGSGVAKIANAFDMNVFAWAPRLTKERAEEQGVTYTTLEDLLRSSDYVVISVRLVPATRHLLTEHHFNLMRNNSFLINTSRGEIVDEEALVKALKEKKIAGAGLDVFTQEPLDPSHPLLRLDNVILSPHIGWKTDTMFNKFLSASVENILTTLIYDQVGR